MQLIYIFGQPAKYIKKLYRVLFLVEYYRLKVAGEIG
jgi:hypothetical protein